MLNKFLIVAVRAERVKEAGACYRGDGADDASMLGCRDCTESEAQDDDERCLRLVDR